MIKCGQRISSSNSWGPGSRCERAGQHVLVYGGRRFLTKSDVYCNVHKAGRARRGWATYTFRPLTDEDKAILEAAQAKENEEARDAMPDILAAERRATVERILAVDPNRLAVCGQDGLCEWVPDARAILDEEAAR